MGYIKVFDKTLKEDKEYKRHRRHIDTTVISNCDTTTDWIANFGIGVTLGNDTSDKKEGNSSLYNSIIGTSDADGNLIFAYDPVTVINLNGKEFIEFWIKSSITGTLYCDIYDIGIAYKIWAGDRFPIIVNVWTKFVLPILAPQGTTGFEPIAVSGTLNLSNINYIDIGVQGVGALSICTLHVDDVKAWAEV